MPLSPEFIERVRAANPIEEVVGEYVQLKRQGKNLMGLCPFHEERTPSFSVSPDKQFFYCFGCHRGGDVVKFLMELEGLAYVEALRKLAARAGIPWPEDEGVRSDPEAERRARLLALLDLAGEYYHRVLVNTRCGKTAREYLQGRGLSPETWRRYRLGYAPPAEGCPGEGIPPLVDFLRRRGYRDDEMRAAGLVTGGEGGDGPDGGGEGFREGSLLRDRMSGRVVLPLQDLEGRIVAFSGRLLGDRSRSPKYLNTPETELFRKGNFLFHLFHARGKIRREGYAVLVEGPMDALTLAQAGLENVVASQGTAFTEEMLRLLRRYAPRVVLVYDGDDSGREAAASVGRNLARAGFDVRIALLPDGLDPDAFVRRFGIERFREEAIERAEGYVAFQLRLLERGHDLRDPQDRVAYLRAALALLAELGDSFLAEETARDLAARLGRPAEEVLGMLNEARRALSLSRERRPSASVGPRVRLAGKHRETRSRIGTTEPLLDVAPLRAETLLMRALLEEPARIPEVLEALGMRLLLPEDEILLAELHALDAEEGKNASAPTAVERAARLLGRLSEERARERLLELMRREDVREPVSEEVFWDWVERVREELDVRTRLPALEAAYRQAVAAGNAAEASRLAREILALRRKHSSGKGVAVGQQFPRREG
ncbi:MAG: DNA primase [Brockia lithotrophica]|uniref:DNA primase n=1 Tax=Brockia lithotrophica TaxID=933949 RepID=A0A2T5G4I5_9BACL|nr:MAG: DNA primase [Brockia lithotrophica]